MVRDAATDGSSSYTPSALIFSYLEHLRMVHVCGSPNPGSQPFPTPPFNTASCTTRDVLRRTGKRLRGIDEVQEADERAEGGSQPDPQPPLHAVVVSHDQPSERLRRFPGALFVGFCSAPLHAQFGGQSGNAVYLSKAKNEV